MSLFDDEFSELAEAVFAGDLAGAEAALDRMHSGGTHCETIRRAKRRARPEMKPDLPQVAPIPLPQPGKTAAEVFGRGGNVRPQGRLKAA